MEDGDFAVAISNPVSGVGIIRVSKAGDIVTPLSVCSRDASLAKGDGAEMRGFVQGFTLHAGRLYCQTTQPKQFLSVSLDSALRERLLLGQQGGSIGERWSVWDPRHQVWWLAGFMNSVTLVAFDPHSEKTLNASKAGGSDFPWFPLAASGPFSINSLNYGGIFLHPTEDRLLLAHDSVAIVELEIATGNSRILSL